MSKQKWIKENLKPGEHYAGIVLGQKGEPDYHLAAFPVDIPACNWEKAKELATLAGGELPNRREARLLAINAPESFDKSTWYWTSEQTAGNADFAWIQDFSDGNQNYGRKSTQYRARAVRRILVIQ